MSDSEHYGWSQGKVNDGAIKTAWRAFHLTSISKQTHMLHSWLADHLINTVLLSEQKCQCFFFSSWTLRTCSYFPIFVSPVLKKASTIYRNKKLVCWDCMLVLHYISSFCIKYRNSAVRLWQADYTSSDSCSSSPSRYGSDSASCSCYGSRLLCQPSVIPKNKNHPTAPY